MPKTARPPALPRSVVDAKCPTPQSPRKAHDDRRFPGECLVPGYGADHPYAALAIKSEKAARNKAKRERDRLMYGHGYTISPDKLYGHRINYDANPHERTITRTTRKRKSTVKHAICECCNLLKTSSGTCPVGTSGTS